MVAFLFIIFENTLRPIFYKAFNIFRDISIILSIIFKKYRIKYTSKVYKSDA